MSESEQRGTRALSAAMNARSRYRMLVLARDEVTAGAVSALHARFTRCGRREHLPVIGGLEKRMAVQALCMGIEGRRRVLFRAPSRVLCSVVTSGLHRSSLRA